MEKPYIFPDIKQKPADIYIANWSRESLPIDITVVSLAQAHLLITNCCAAHWREKQKRKKYEYKEGFFIPLPVESSVVGVEYTCQAPLSSVFQLLGIPKASQCIANTINVCAMAASCLE